MLGKRAVVAEFDTRYSARSNTGRVVNQLASLPTGTTVVAHGFGGHLFGQMLQQSPELGEHVGGFLAIQCPLRGCNSARALRALAEADLRGIKIAGLILDPGGWFRSSPLGTVIEATLGGLARIRNDALTWQFLGGEYEAVVEMTRPPNMAHLLKQIPVLTVTSEGDRTVTLEEGELPETKGIRYGVDVDHGTLVYGCDRSGQPADLALQQRLFTEQLFALWSL
jgi:hypothetical protein